jgi:hypothetical protein
VELSEIVPGDLSDWGYSPRRGQVVVDPVLGRIAFPVRGAPETGVWVDYHHGFSAEMGGGEYDRPLPLDEPRPYRVGPGPGDDFQKITAAVEHWQQEKAKDAEKRQAVIELTDSGAYQEDLEFALDRGDRLTIRAAQGRRPVLRLLDWYGNRPDALRIKGTGKGAAKAPLPSVVLDGLLVTGRSVRVSGPVGRVVLRHTTLVPGWSLDQHCRPTHEEEASVELFDTPACLQAEHSILGTILVNADEVGAEPNRVWLSDSVLDAAGRGLAAVTGPDDRHAHAELSARRTTVFGSVAAHAVGLVENSVVTGRTRIARRQSGCVRFSWVRPGSRTPARFHCEPDTSGEPARVVPHFTSTRYGTPGYAQLAVSCPAEIRRGAADGAELGAFHDLYQPQREDNLRARLTEYTPAGSDAGIVIVT